MWRLLDLGAVSGYTMTNLYEAVGRAVSSGDAPNTVMLDHPEAPFVNIGYHLLMDKEINVDYARRMGFSLVRRTIGGGAILDGPWEQDYFVVVKRGSPDCPATIPEFYGRFLKAPMYALKALGLEPTLRPPNDILVNGRKISGNGAITIEGTNVLAGDLLLEAPTALMSEIITASSEKFRDKLAQSMSEWVTSIKVETGNEPDRGHVKGLIVKGFREELGIELIPGELTQVERKNLKDLVEARMTEDWIFSKDNDLLMKTGGARGAKVRGGVTVSEADHKAGKLIRVVLVSEEGRVADVSISGDFFTQPYTGAVEQLEKLLRGTPLNEDALLRRINEAYKMIGLTVYGAGPEDFVKAIMKARVETG
ncbi:MAG: lipoate--protein ligase [Candidatus Bathyarchaeota archaeon]